MDHPGVVHQAEFRRCLVELDVRAIRLLWGHVFPDHPQPSTDEETLATLHYARTVAASLPLRLRAYSHRYLAERGLPSGLPDELRPSAERMYPRVVEGVGLSFQTSRMELRPILDATQRQAEAAISDLYASSRSPNPGLVRARVEEVRRRMLREAAVVKVDWS